MVQHYSIYHQHAIHLPPHNTPPITIYHCTTLICITEYEITDHRKPNIYHHICKPTHHITSHHVTNHHKNTINNLSSTIQHITCQHTNDRLLPHKTSPTTTSNHPPPRIIRHLTKHIYHHTFTTKHNTYHTRLLPPYIIY